MKVSIFNLLIELPFYLQRVPVAGTCEWTGSKAFFSCSPQFLLSVTDKQNNVALATHLSQFIKNLKCL